MLWPHMHKTTLWVSNSPTMVVYPIRMAKESRKALVSRSCGVTDSLFALLCGLLHIQMREQRKGVPAIPTLDSGVKLDGLRVGKKFPLLTWQGQPAKDLMTHARLIHTQREFLMLEILGRNLNRLWACRSWKLRAKATPLASAA
jgi:hypothetical protein